MKETLEYKCLQSQFSLLYNESLGVKTQLDEARALLLTAKNAHLRQIEHMEVIQRTVCLCIFVNLLNNSKKMQDLGTKCLCTLSCAWFTWFRAEQVLSPVHFF